MISYIKYLLLIHRKIIEILRAKTTRTIKMMCGNILNGLLQKMTDWQKLPGRTFEIHATRREQFYLLELGSHFIDALLQISHKYEKQLF